LLIAAVVAFAPTLILMFTVLKKYTYPAVQNPFFSDPKLFGMFTIGLVVGTILIAVNWMLGAFFNLIFCILYAAIQCLVVVAIMNLKRFHGKSDTVFYGYGLGLGIGCTYALGFMYYFTATASDVIEEVLDLTSLAWLAIIALSFILMFSAIGTTISEGVARLRPMEFMMQAIFSNVVFSLTVTGSMMFNESVALMMLVAVVALAVAAVYFYAVVHKGLSKVVRDVLKAEGKPTSEVPK